MPAPRISLLIQSLKRRRFQQFASSFPKGAYALVGIGSHSFDNLLPVIQYLQIQLKYIVTKQADSARFVDLHFANSEGTNDLKKVLDDPEIVGVFICTRPEAHFDLIAQSLKAGKNVFVEKPPCYSADELKHLIQLEKMSKGSCLVGLQKRYAPAMQALKTVKNATSYRYEFLTGKYPEGNSIYELFIHPIDLLLWLFGELTSVSIQRSSDGSFFLQLHHLSGVVGQAEVSTAYSWTRCNESLSVNTTKGTYACDNLEKLTFYPRQGSILGIPKEKVFAHKNVEKVIFERDHFIASSINNPIYTKGYFNEIKAFTSLCEDVADTNASALISLTATYDLLHQLQKNP